jgi:hypothetical protein
MPLQPSRIVRHRELVADLAPKGTRLPKLDVMRIGRTPATDKARLRTHEVSMRFIAFADRLYESADRLYESDRGLIILHRS